MSDLNFGAFHVDPCFPNSAAPGWLPAAIWGRRAGRWVEVRDLAGLCSGESADDALTAAGFRGTGQHGLCVLLIAERATEITRAWPFAATLNMGGGRVAVVLMASLPDLLDALPGLAMLAGWWRSPA